MESRNAQIARENERLRLEGIAREREAVQADLLAQQIRSRGFDIGYIASTPVVGADVVKGAALARKSYSRWGVVGGAVLRGGSARLEGFRRLSEDVEEEDLDDEEMDDEEFDGELDDELDDEDFDDEDME